MGRGWTTVIQFQTEAGNFGYFFLYMHHAECHPIWNMEPATGYSRTIVACFYSEDLFPTNLMCNIYT
jgi:hypothetical protein